MEPLRELSTLIVRHMPKNSFTAANDALGLRFSSVPVIEEPAHVVYEPVFALIVQGEKELISGRTSSSAVRGPSSSSR